MARWSARGSRVQPGARVVVPEVPADEERTNWARVVTAVSKEQAIAALEQAKDALLAGARPSR